ncbi:MAG: efflux RND transporter periplasmic adaptor subunit [Acidobacteriota bacterium]|nr:efflux RND transporter periplasmic adaptor subunit [Acidobacteriota bacterium]MDH3783784.1 efflux RND transporter periplasmic adaptor subunit [Acidobacteriota bacterium]
MNGKQMARNGFFLLLILLIGALTLSGCSFSSGSESDSDDKKDPATPASQQSTDDDDADAKDDDAEGKDEDKEEAVPIEVEEIQLGSIESVLRFSTNLETEKQVKVVSQARRLVIDLKVEEGDSVKENQILLRLQDDEQRSQLAKVRSQLAKAQREYTNQERLYKQDLISEDAYTNATYEMEQLEISLADAERELSYTEVRAPIRGTVTSRMINLGDQVQIGQELFEIVDFNSMVARIFVPEKHLPRLSRGQDSRMTAQAGARQAYTGRVTRISPVVDPKSGTIKVTIGVGNQAGLRPGMYVDVELITATNEDAVLIPKRAIVYDNDQMFVYRLGVEHRVERVYIETSLEDKHFVEPEDGVRAGDRLVVAGQAGLKDGALVRLPGEDDVDDAAAIAEADGTVTERASL